MDDLNDLDWSVSAQQTSKPSPFQSSFDLLASSSSSTSTSSSAFYNSTRTVSPQPPPLAPFGAAKPSISQQKPQKSTDAFADLFSLGGVTRAPGSRGGGASSSMAEEQARLREEAARKKEAEHKGFESQGAFWNSLGGSGLAGSTTPLVPSRSSTPQTSRPLASTSSAKAPSRTNPSDIWSEFDLLSSSSNPGPPPSSSTTDQRLDAQSTPSLILTPPSSSSGKTGPASDPFDFFLNQTPVNGNGPSGSKQATAANKVQASAARGDEDDWEFTGNIREGKERGGLLEDSEEDDFMSAFNTKSVEVKATTLRPAQSSSSSSSRRGSPPPHIVGQLVEMGFTPAQARQALGSTESGLDVQMAASMLLSESSDQSKHIDRGFSDQDGNGDDDERERDRLRLIEEAAAAERRRKRRQGPSRSSVATGGASDLSRSATNTPPNEGATTPLQEQAAKILAQTNLLGTSVFNRANAFWKEGKSQVQKAYEERTAAANAGNSRSSTPANDGRPKWMTENIQNVDGSDKEEPRAQSHSSGFKDGFADERLQEDAPTHRPQRERPVNQKPAKAIEQPSLLLSAASKIGSLFSTAEDEPRSYVSPNRRPPARQSSSSLTTPPVSRPSPFPPAKPLMTRPIPSISTSSIESVSAHRTKGNEFFKLGQFGEAEGAYTQAISILPDGHPRSIPLYNNRATSRLKNGDHTGSASDSTMVIDMVGLDYHPDKEVPLPSDLSDINLGDGLVKAIVKRANAMELGERWSKAKEDWDLVGRLEINVPGATKIAAMDGSRRCKKMVDLMNGVSAPAIAPSSSASSSSTTKRKPPPRAAPSSSTGAASALLKATTAALESEDLQRDQHKDAVDARILSWKAGKETNVRALIGSLENVLWPELDWQKVGLHELVTDKQVKIKYTRAVGKVHPDKLNAGNTTVEQRMIANGVFAALNEAWNAGQK
ncbi:Auxilin-like protein and related proteins containing DnaJ domain [Phaffia rhodozyma]|uniref:Auxilin-like protein and related proteins containing DnaJ domain n=1 Tax=Phaffia rhodozyma TaxID=264483 RepID=A0A0F7SK25_PHARH|nr:Auxilin-like protein and related proteins containing DnaJ domain [Phaffia rhodozyma]